MYSTEIASFLGTMQKISVNEYMLYSIVLLQGCGIMYKVVMWRLGCRRNGKKKKVTSSNDVEKQLNRIVVVPEGRGFTPVLSDAVQPAESKKIPLGRGHSITLEQEDNKATAQKSINE